MSKFSRKVSALWKETTKRLPYIIILMGVFLLIQGYQNSKDTKAIAENTNSIVNGQDDILRAIAKGTNQGNITAQQQTSIIICMLQVPIAERTTNLLEKCRKDVEQKNPTLSQSAAGNSKDSVSDTPVVSTPASREQNQTVAPTQASNNPPAITVPRQPLIPLTSTLQVITKPVCDLTHPVCLVL